MNDNNYEYLTFKDWIQQQEWNDPDWIVLSRYTFGKEPFWTHSVLLYLDRMGEIEKIVPDQVCEITQKTILELLFSEYYLDNELLGKFEKPDVYPKINNSVLN